MARYQTLYDRDKIGTLSKAELRALKQEFTDLGARSGELDARVIQMQAAAQQYFTEHHVAQARVRGRSWTEWLITLVVASASALACGLVARKKNRKVVGWGVFGFFIPIAALIAVLAVRKVELEPRSAPLLKPRL